jgi:hypothetical protein
MSENEKTQCFPIYLKQLYVFSQTTDDIKVNLEDLEKELTHITDVLKLRLWSKCDDNVAKSSQHAESVLPGVVRSGQECRW